MVERLFELEARLPPWLRWTLSLFAYLTTFGSLTAAGPFSRQDLTFYAMQAGLCALGAWGLLLLDDRRPGRLSPKGYRVLQGRQRLWAEAALTRLRLLPRPAPAPSSFKTPSA